MRKKNTRRLRPHPFRLFLMLRWKHVALGAFAIALWTVPAGAQKNAQPLIGAGTRNDCRPTWGSPCGVTQNTIPDMPMLPKPVLARDEDCLPWNLSSARDSASSVTTLKVPSNARREYEKACDAYRKKKFNDAEQHLRGAIGKFQDYSAAWVMLGVVLDGQKRVPAARDACSRAAKADARYLPAYLCAAEFSTRNQEWEELLNLTNAAIGLNSQGDGYVHFYRAMAYLHLNNLVDAQTSALKAAEMDVNHNYLPIYFLLAQLYDAEGNKVNAAAQLRQVLEHHPNQNEEYAAKQFLATLDAEQAARIAKKRSATGDDADTGELTGSSADRTDASMADLPRGKDSWIPEDIDHTAPPVASGVACSLPDVLDGAGKRIVEFIHNVDRFTATEVIMHRAINLSGHLGPPIIVKSDYLVSFVERSSGYLHVDEIRNGNPEFDGFPAHIVTIGTPSLVLIFHPRYVANFNVTCEGLGEWYGRPAWLVRFEQRADRPNHTLSYTVNQEEYRANLKGRAWILADSFQIARLETDLVESVPKIRLRLFHESLEYRPVKSPVNNLEFWLPSGAELYMDFQGQRFYRELAFTDFSLFSVGMQYQTSDPKEAPAAP